MIILMVCADMVGGWIILVCVEGNSWLNILLFWVFYGVDVKLHRYVLLYYYLTDVEIAVKLHNYEKNY